MIAEIIGPDILIVLGIVVLLFGGSQLPKFAGALWRLGYVSPEPFEASHIPQISPCPPIGEKVAIHGRF